MLFLLGLFVALVEAATCGLWVYEEAMGLRHSLLVMCGLGFCATMCLAGAVVELQRDKALWFAWECLWFVVSFYLLVRAS